MKKQILMILVSLMSFTGTAHADDFVWGKATWNIQDGTTFKSIDELKENGLTLTYPYSSSFPLTFLHVITVEYNLYIDDATEPIQSSASAQMSAVVDFTERYADDFVEGHRYKIVTTKASLNWANLATYETEVLSTNEDSYTISFVIEGPELVKTIEVEGTMALTITDQDWWPTFSELDTEAIKNALGITETDEAAVKGLNKNGSYNPYYIDPFDGWRDAEGEFTVWGGNAYNLLGHNAYPAVYCIKMTETLDSVYYYFYDHWKVYNPEDPGEVPGSETGVKRRAPETHFYNTVWDWEWIDDEGNPQVTKYTRYWRCDEGEDYKASFAIIANGKMVRVNATMHFVSQEQFAELTPVNSVKVVESSNTAIYSLDGRRQQSLTRGLNIVRQGNTVRKILK